MLVLTLELYPLSTWTVRIDRLCWRSRVDDALGLPLGAGLMHCIFDKSLLVFSEHCSYLVEVRNTVQTVSYV